MSSPKRRRLLTDHLIYLAETLNLTLFREAGDSNDVFTMAIEEPGELRFLVLGRFCLATSESSYQIDSRWRATLKSIET